MVKFHLQNYNVNPDFTVYYAYSFRVKCAKFVQYNTFVRLNGYLGLVQWASTGKSTQSMHELMALPVASDMHFCQLHQITKSYRDFYPCCHMAYALGDQISLEKC